MFKIIAVIVLCLLSIFGRADTLERSNQSPASVAWECLWSGSLDRHDTGFADKYNSVMNKLADIARPSDITEPADVTPPTDGPQGEITKPDAPGDDVAPPETEPDVGTSIDDPATQVAETTSIGEGAEQIEPEITTGHVCKYTETVIAPTCTADGKRVCTCECGETYSEPIAKLGHRYQKRKETPPTCTKAGSTLYVCECGESYRETSAALGHNYAFTKTVAPTETAIGYDLYTCKRCGSTEKHNYVDMIVLTPCQKGNHSYVEVSHTEPTCTTDGNIRYECECGSVKTESISKLGHKLIYAETVVATKEHEGYDVYRCERCGYVEHQNIKPQIPTDALLCSMVDYTKCVMPHEQYADIISQMLAISDRFRTGSDIIYFGIDSMDAYFASDDEIQMSRRYYREFWFSTATKNSAGCFMTVTNQQQKYFDQYQQIMAWGDRVVTELGVNEMTTWEDALDRFNLYLCDNMRYDYDNYSHSILVGIEQKTGVCMVYSMMFQVLCQKVGIECYYDKNDTENHAFNYIMYPDGTKLYVDVTWNDARVIIGGKTIEVEDATDLSPATKLKYRRKYFLLDEDTFVARHEWKSLH